MITCDKCNRVFKSDVGMNGHRCQPDTKCIVLGCSNTMGQGTFNGVLCAPCDTMLRTGVVGQGNTFIQKMRESIVSLQKQLGEK